MTYIAIVDNDPSLVSLLEELFNERGWESASYADVGAATAGFKRRVPDLIFLDIWLDSPNSGWSLLRQLKQDPEQRTIPIIVCSGAAEHLADKEDWLRQHGIPVLYKPFGIDEVYRTVSEAIAHSVPGKLER